MSDTYKNFVRYLKAASAIKNLSIQDVADITNVSRSTVYNWFNFKSVMDGESVIRAILYIMDGGVKC